MLLLQQPRDGMGKRLRFVVAGFSIQRDVNLHAFRSGGFCEALQSEMVEDDAHPECDLRALHDVCGRSGIEVEDDHGRRFDIGGQCQRGMQFQRRQVCDPDERGQVVGQNEIDGAVIAVAPDGSRLHPLRAMHRRVFFKEILMVHTFGIPLHGQRMSREMRHQYRRNADVIVDHLTLGEAGGGIENLVQVGKIELTAFDFDDGGSGHGIG